MTDFCLGFPSKWSWYAVQDGEVCQQPLFFQSKIVSWFYHITSILCLNHLIFSLFFLFQPPCFSFSCLKVTVSMGFSVTYMIFFPCSIHDNKLRVIPGPFQPSLDILCVCNCTECSTKQNISHSVYKDQRVAVARLRWRELELEEPKITEQVEKGTHMGQSVTHCYRVHSTLTYVFKGYRVQVWHSM